MDAPVVGGLGGTFGGNPLACAAALAVLDQFEDGNLLARANEFGECFAERARAWQKRWPMIGDVRGLGAMRAIEFVRSAATREPAADETKRIVRWCYEHGLVVLSAGTYGNVVRVLVPLVITNEQFEEGLGVLELGLEAVVSGERRER